MDMISADNLCYSIAGKKILDGLNQFSMNRKDLVCISGPSGGGKTTFLNALAGLNSPDSGEIYWGEHQIVQNKKNLDKLRLDWISLIFQEPRLAKNLTGWENIFLPLKISNRMKHFKEPLLHELLDALFLAQGMSQVELDKLLHTKVSNYSGGQMQRIAIIRAMLTLPKYIFADEILNSLEPELQEKTWATIKEICKQNEIGFLLITHNVFLLQDTDFTKKITIKKGKIIND